MDQAFENNLGVAYTPDLRSDQIDIMFDGHFMWRNRTSEGLYEYNSYLFCGLI